MFLPSTRVHRATMPASTTAIRLTPARSVRLPDPGRARGLLNTAVRGKARPRHVPGHRQTFAAIPVSRFDVPPLGSDASRTALPDMPGPARPSGGFFSCPQRDRSWMRYHTPANCRGRHGTDPLLRTTNRPGPRSTTPQPQHHPNADKPISSAPRRQKLAPASTNSHREGRPTAGLATGRQQCAGKRPHGHRCSASPRHWSTRTPGSTGPSPGLRHVAGELPTSGCTSPHQSVISVRADDVDYQAPGRTMSAVKECHRGHDDVGLPGHRGQVAGTGVAQRQLVAFLRAPVSTAPAAGPPSHPRPITTMRAGDRDT